MRSDSNWPDFGYGEPLPRLWLLRHEWVAHENPYVFYDYLFYDQLQEQRRKREEELEKKRQKVLEWVDFIDRMRRELADHVRRQTIFKGIPLYEKRYPQYRGKGVRL